VGWLVHVVSPVALPTGSVASSRYGLLLHDSHDLHMQPATKICYRRVSGEWRRNMFCRLSILGSMVESSLAKDGSSKRAASVCQASMRLF
jgi:hypothetical protein